MYAKLLGTFKEKQILHMCHVSRSSFNSRVACMKKEEERKAAEEKKNCQIKEKMRQICIKTCSVPGTRTFKTYLWRMFDMNVGIKHIGKLMKEMNMSATVRRKDAYKGKAKHDHACTAPENLVNQNFRIKPRHIICTDVTYLYYGLKESLIYLCVFKDAFTKEILGWAVDNRMTTDLIQTAYDMMNREHGHELKTNDVLVHSDQGCQYLSTTFKELLKNDEYIQSVSARANSQDNAPVESFFGLIKTNLLSVLKMCPDEETAIEIVNNRIRSYNTEEYQYNLAGLTPHEFYLYQTTGIYPCDNYYGVKADNLKSIEEIVSDKLEKDRIKADQKRREYQERSRAARLLKKNPIELTISDQGILKKEIQKYKEHKARIENEIDRLEHLLKEAEAAEVYLASLSSEELEEYRDPQKWQMDPKLQYIYGMSGMF